MAAKKEVAPKGRAFFDLTPLFYTKSRASREIGFSVYASATGCSAVRGPGGAASEAGTRVWDVVAELAGGGWRPFADPGEGNAVSWAG
jgi:hypothetical protein